jgi:cell division protein FtsN
MTRKEWEVLQEYIAAEMEWVRVSMRPFSATESLDKAIAEVRKAKIEVEKLVIED